jgi:hypothetical protein
MEKFKVIVTFQDQSKKIPLVVTPSADLDKFRTEEAYKRFNRTVRSVFSLPPTAKFTFHEKATGAELCSESFLSERFSKRWNLVVEGMDELLNGSGDNSPPSSVKVSGFARDSFTRPAHILPYSYVLRSACMSEVVALL